MPQYRVTGGEITLEEILPPPAPPSLPPPPPPVVTRPQLLGTHIYPGLVRSDADLARYDFVQYHPYTAEDIATFGQVPRLRTLRPSIKVLAYYHVHGQWDWQADWATINAHEVWFVHAANGARILAGSGAGWWLMDMSNPEFLAYVNQRIVNILDTYGFDGLSQDGPFPMLSNDRSIWPGYNQTIPDAVITAWPQWAVGQIRSTRQALGTRMNITNTTPWIEALWLPNWMDTLFLPYVDGTAMEGFAHPYWSLSTEYIGEATWDWQMVQYQRKLDAGKLFYMLSGVDDYPSGDVRKRWQVFTFASYMLKADGRLAVYSWSDKGPTTVYFPEMDENFGASLGAATKIGGVWQRDFANQRVFVNPSESETRSRDGITLLPMTAQIVPS